MTTKHTPGPWNVDKNGLSGYGDNGNTFNILAENGAEIAHLPSSFRLLDIDDETDDEYVEESANARLIAAAPEMAEALGGSLQYVLAWLYEYSQLPPTTHNKSQAKLAAIQAERIEALLAKLEG